MIMSRHLTTSTSKLVACLSQRSTTTTRCSAAWYTNFGTTQGNLPSKSGTGVVSKPVLLFNAGRTLQPVLTRARDVFGLQQGQGQANMMSSLAGAAVADHEQPDHDLNQELRHVLYHELGSKACPQGIQGDNCEEFLEGIERCRNYSVENCSDMIQGIQSGRTTVGEVLAEQEDLVSEISQRYKDAVTHHTIEQINPNFLPELYAPCPQGIQGDDCAQFTLWLKTCHQFGFKEYMERLQGYQKGGKLLQDIFAQQDLLIRKILRQNYPTVSCYSTSSQSKDDSQDPKVRTEESAAPKELLTQTQKLKRAVKEYGSTVIVFHVCISLASLGGFYLAVSSGLDVVGMMQKFGVAETLLQSKAAAGAGTFVVAYAVHKLFAPVRIGITLTATPFIVRYLRKIGFLKVPK